MSVLEKLSQEEKDLFISYVKTFGPNGNSSDDDDSVYELNQSIEDIAPAEHLLRFWNDAKGVFLEKVFGNNLICRKKIEYETPIEEIDFETLYWSDLTRNLIRKCSNSQPNGIYYTQVQHNCEDNESEMPSDFIYEYNANGKWINTIMDSGWYCQKLRDFAYDKHYAYNNIYDGPTFMIKRKDKDGAPLKIVSGCKYSKAMGKVANYLDIPFETYEAWRKQHSLLINEKLLTGYLCLSIHPMDYITMSDATFVSCMNWINTGGYRRGTVEMMNSSKVAVAYLETEKESLDWYDNGTKRWNMKKWRTLLIAEPDFISSVKAYPYANNELTIKALEMLQEMITKVYDYHYVNHIFEFTEEYFRLDNADKINIEFLTSGAMYCDMGTTKHFLMMTEDFDPTRNYICDYCGQSECMFCGAVGSNYDFPNESCVFCNNCQAAFPEEDYVYCDSCGERISAEDAIFSESGRCYCYSCAQTYTRPCVRCGTIYETTDLYPIILSYDKINKVKNFDVANLEDLMLEKTDYAGCCGACKRTIERFKTGDSVQRVYSWLTPEKIAKEEFGVESLDDIHLLPSEDDVRYIRLDMKPGLKADFDNAYFKMTGNLFSRENITDTLKAFQDCIDLDKEEDYLIKTREEILEQISKENSEYPE